MNCTVYAIVCKETQTPLYVGSTYDIYRRRSRHLTLLERGQHDSPRLQKVYDNIKNNGLSVEIKVLEKGDWELPEEVESKWIKELSKVYELCNRRDPLTQIRTKECREKISKSLKGRVLTEEWKAKIAKARKGQKWDDFIRVESNLKRKKFSEEEKKIIAEKKRNTRKLNKEKIILDKTCTT